MLKRLSTRQSATVDQDGSVPTTAAINDKGRWMKLMRRQPCFVLVPALVALLVLAAGLVVAFTIEASQINAARTAALSLAEDTGQSFSRLLDQTLLPLFSLAQFVTELPIFSVLPKEIGPTAEKDRVPFAFNSTTHRNVSGICDDPDSVERFNNIAKDIKRNAKLEGILVNLQLAPQAVVCMVYPLNNTEDFSDGKFLDNSGAVGHDLLFDPERKVIAEATVPSDSLVIAGPLKLTTCSDCPPTISSALIARLPIYSATDIITVNDVPYPRWGFSVAIISWEAAVKSSGIYELFNQLGQDFQLSRIDESINSSGVSEQELVVLAETAEYQHKVENGYRIVKAELETTNDTWIIKIAYSSANHNFTFGWIVVISMVFSSSIGLLFFIVLMQKQVHNEIKMEQTALLIQNARHATMAERELNEFIAHEVRNPLSAAISACNFIKSIVHEKDPMKNECDIRSVREDVHIIEHSLKFINDLLRSLLDIHKAQDKHMTLNLETIDILMDVLEPVAAMLYHRNEKFNVIIECEPKQIIVQADRLRLQQIILNLSRNAVKFVETGYVRIRASVENEEVCIFVEDSGPGVPTDKRGNLFCRFQDSLDALAQGTGLGLNLCKALVDLMNGEIWLDESFQSGVEGCPGTRIVINLKVQPAGSEMVDSSWMLNTSYDLEDEMDKAKPLPENLSVLFVDDDRVLRKLGVRALKKITPTWNVREAANGETALQLSKSELFDIIFLDQYMTSVEQALKGTETVRAMRSEGICSIICGLSANDLADLFLEAGADGFIMKPFPCKEDELLSELSRLINQNTKSARLLSTRVTARSGKFRLKSFSNLSWTDNLNESEKLRTQGGKSLVFNKSVKCTNGSDELV